MKTLINSLILFCCLIVKVPFPSFVIPNISSSAVYVDETIKYNSFPKAYGTNTIHLFSHGRSGELLLNGEWKNAEQIASFIKANKILSIDAKQLNLYGCEFAKGQKGLVAVAYLEKTLNLKIAASTNITGTDGDWLLEYGNEDASNLRNSISGNLQCAGVAGGVLPADDFDQDGVCNIVDLDDDNDGVLDEVESPACFFNLASLHKAATITTDMGWTASDPIALAFDKLSSTFAIKSGATNIANQALMDVSFPLANPVRISSVLVEIGTISFTLSSFVLEALNTTSNLWETLSAAQGMNTINSTYTFNNTLFSNNTYRRFRIIARSGTGGIGVRVIEVRYNFTEYYPSLQPKTTCTDDMDNDGVLNQFDLDSDGDGCTDAIESGTTVVSGATTLPGNVRNGSGGSVTSNTSMNNAIIEGSYGDNGFANSLETNTLPESNIYKSVYETYFLSYSTSSCVDSDNDTKLDIGDIDDDNDGILDCDEGLFGAGQRANVIANNATKTATFSGNDNTVFATVALTVSPSATIIASGGGSTMEGTNSLVNQGINFGGGANDKWVNYNITSQKSGIYGFVISNQSENPYQQFQVNGGAFKIDFDESIFTAKLVSVVGGTIPGLAVNSPIISGELYLKSPENLVYIVKLEPRRDFMIGTSTQIKHWIVDETTAINSESPSLGLVLPNCQDRDTDKDGIPNRLDLDSDGDGCSDGLEGVANFIPTNTPTAPLAGGNTGGSYNGYASSVLINFPTPVNASGVPTAVNGGAGQGIGLSQIKSDDINNNGIGDVCQDTDNDGISDTDDLDDDNDGILDAVESPACYYTSAEAGIILGIRSSLNGAATPTPADPLAGAEIASLHNGSTSDASPFNFAASQIAAQTVNIFTISYPTEVVLSSLTVTQAASGMSTNGFGRLWGSTNGVDYTLLTTAANGVALNATSVVFSITNTTPFRHYQIQSIGTVAAGNATAITIGTANIQEITAVRAASHVYIPSAHPKPTCAANTDGDALLNHLDLDSDGDGCSDAFEGAGNFNPANNSSISGGNTGGSYNGYAGPVIVNLTTTAVDMVSTSASYGVPTVVGAGQGIGLSQIKSDDINNNGIGDVCQDTDNDGISDTDDLDDDNDGILDAVESPACYYTSAEAGIILGIRSSLNGAATPTPADPLAGAEIASLHNGSTSDASPFNFAASQIAAQAVNIFTISYPTEVVLSSLTVTQASSGMSTNGFGRLWGSTNGVDYTLLTTAVNGVALNATSVVFSITNTTPFRHYQIQSIGTVAAGNATAITIGTANIQEITAVRAASHVYIPSAHPKPTCAANTDGDALLNHLDLDSDGDGCSDAFEGAGNFNPANNSSISGGNTGGSYNGYAGPVIVNLTTTAVDMVSTSASYGVPTDAGAGQGIGSSQTISDDVDGNHIGDDCEDSDGDGVFNTQDIDDDNDGVLDTVEDICQSTPAYASKWNIGVYDYTPTELSCSDPNNLGPLTQTASGTMTSASDLSLNWANGGTETSLLTSLNMGGGSITGANPPDITFAVYHEHTFTSLDAGIYTIDAGTVYDGKKFSKVLTSGVDSLIFCTDDWSLQSTAKDVVFEVGSKLRIIVYENGVVNTQAVININPKAGIEQSFNCMDLDTDNDGVPNRLDLDSDGDGCPDAIEAGVAKTTGGPTMRNGVLKNGSNNGSVTNEKAVPNAVVAEPYGANGFANSVEVPGSPESNQYNSTYTYSMATDKMQQDKMVCDALLGVALPVTWASVSATWKNAYAELLWTVATEENLSHYEIERSYDGSNFVKIGTQAPNNNKLDKHYSFQDVSISPNQSGRVYYRIRSVDNDGKTGHSRTVSLLIGQGQSKITAYPIPNNGHLQFTNLKDVKSIKIYSINGAVVKQFSNIRIGQLSYDVSELANGLYVITLIKENAEVIHLKMQVLK